MSISPSPYNSNNEFIGITADGFTGLRFYLNINSSPLMLTYIAQSDSSPVFPQTEYGLLLYGPCTLTYYLVGAGGGGAYSGFIGGGGGGGNFATSSLGVNAQELSLFVGVGGDGGGYKQQGVSGGDSSVIINGNTFTANGGSINTDTSANSFNDSNGKESTQDKHPVREVSAIV